MSERAAWAEINLSALAHNYRVIKHKLEPGAKLCAVVKANAYGHGAVPVARVAVENGAKYLAVATLDEGRELREAGFTEPILLLGLILPEEARTAVMLNLTQAVADIHLAKAISRAACEQNKIASVHLKVDTGMGRIGIFPEDAVRLALEITKLLSLKLTGIFSHFAEADSEDKSFTYQQLKVFKGICIELKTRGLELLCHIAESAAIMEIPEAHLDMCRAGIIQYGLFPAKEMIPSLNLMPVMSLKARIVYLKDVPQGVSIGYGRDFITKRQSRIATLPLGYADGYIRAYSKGQAKVLIKGKLVPVVGRICMDQFMVDVTDAPGTEIGDVATIFGAGELTINDAADYIDTINYEAVCLVSSRVPRIYIR